PVVWLFSLLLHSGLALSDDAACRSQSEPGVSAGILDRCFADAIVRGGIGMERLLAPEFRYNTSQGSRVDRAYLLTWLADARGSIPHIRIDKVHEQRLSDEVLLSSGVMEVKREGASGLLRSRYLHVWTYAASAGWRLVARQVTALQEGD